MNTKRILRSGLQNFFRSGFVSFASVVVMMITLFIILSTMLFGGFLHYSLDQVRAKVDINVYFVTSASEQDVLAVQKSLEALPEVAEVDYVSADQALADFEAKHQGDQLTLQSIDELGTNPLGASLNIRAKDPSQYAGIATYLDSNDSELLSSDGSKIIDKVNYAQNKLVIDRLTTIINSANMLGFWLAVIFILISLIVTFNTIRLTIFMARDEISVMRLVGASNKYVKGPFVVSGILTGLISAFLITLFFGVLTFWVTHYYGTYFIGFDPFSYYKSSIWSILGIIFGSGILFGGIASYFAVQRYLKD